MTTTKRAKLDVQLIGYTVFEPPIDRETGKWVFTPDEGNIEVEQTAFNGTLYDAQALVEFGGRACYQSFDRPNPKTATNATYIARLIGQKHESVLEHGSVSVYATGVSRALSHEGIRHRHHSPSQLSQRYVPTDDIRFVVPPALLEEFGSVVDEMAEEHGEPVHPVTGAPATREEVVEFMAEEWAKDIYARTVGEYQETAALLGPEQSKIKRSDKQIREAARYELPNAAETRFVLTGNFRAWKNFLIQRDSPAADAEMQLFAKEVGKILAEVAPNIFGAEARALWDDGVEHGEAQTPEA